MNSRNPNRASTVYLGADGSWHGRVTVGFRDDGSLDRRHVRGKTKGAVVQKVRALERHREQAQSSGPATVGRWAPGSNTGLRTSPSPISATRATPPIGRLWSSTSFRTSASTASIVSSLNTWSVCIRS
jgi:hypothetical protein